MCKVLSITRCKNPILAKYYLCSSEIQRVDTESDLGITVTYNLPWNNYINKIVTNHGSCPLLTDSTILDFVSFVNHTRTHHCENSSLVLKVPRCKTSTFHSFFFNRIAPLWNCICTLASPDDSHIIVWFKTFLAKTYLDLLTITFDVNMACSWSLCHSCSCHRGEINII